MLIIDGKKVSLDLKNELKAKITLFYFSTSVSSAILIK